MSDPNAADDADDVRRRSRPYLLVGCGVVAIEALALLALAIAEFLSVEGDRVGLGVSTAVFFLVVGAGVGYCVYGLWRRVSWVRGPIVLVQLIMLGLAWNFRTISPTVIAVVLLILALTGLVAVLSPATTRALNAEDDRL
ncbi:MAG TPA: hypothetical protein VK059_09805 [Nocardioidaceae bacterium]|nr:hypothetical protein [Nocardioidaceae bacterium]